MTNTYFAALLPILILYCIFGMNGYPPDEVFPMGLGSRRAERLVFPLFKHRLRPASIYLISAALLDYILIGGVFAILPRFLSVPDLLSTLVYAILSAEALGTLCAVCAWYGFHLPGRSKWEKIGLRVGGVLLSAVTVAAILYPFSVL